MSNPANPCTAQRAGCSADPEPGRAKCKSCRAVLARDAATRRAERKRARACTVCGKAAAKGEDGQLLATCAAHREYYRARAVVSRADASTVASTVASAGRDPESALP